jgi:uncharacterized protein (DUF58 family)
MPALGRDYYGRRGYHAGDDYPKVNWKATARQGELIVMERMKEVGGSLLLVLDARAPGFYDTDRLASAFLSIANTLTAAGISFGVIVHDGKKVTTMSQGEDPRVNLGIALKAALSFVRLDTAPEFLELVPGRVSKQLTAIAEGLGKDSRLLLIPGIRRSEARTLVEKSDPWATTSGYLRDRSVRSVLYVSGLFAGLEPLIELAWQSRHQREADFSVVNPCDARSTEDGKSLPRHQKLARALATAGVRYYRGEPTDLAGQALSV